MLRRAYLSVLAALPIVSVPDRLTRRRETPPAVEQEDNHRFWWYVYSAATRNGLSTERSRDRAIDELTLTDLTDDEAREVLQRAYDGVYTIDDIPERWRRVLRSIDKVEYR